MKFRNLAKDVLGQALLRTTRPSAVTNRKTIVFAPHQDDETLGCGGVIKMKAELGTDLLIVFLTDGSRSHSAYIKPEILAEIRKIEARNACRELGVSEDRVIFLEFPDRTLSENLTSAIRRVDDIISQIKPEEIFTPYRYDTTEDHVATNKIVREAIGKSGLACEVFEYPVWFWFHWPWVGIDLSNRSNRKVYFLNSLRNLFGYKALRVFNHSIDISNLLQTKRTALHHHKTQVDKPDQQPEWWVLADVSSGDFVDCFFREREYFVRYAL